MHTRVSRRSLLALTGSVSISGLVILVGLIAPARAGAFDLVREKNTVVAEGPGAGITRILLINPNTNQTTTDMMVRIAQSSASNNVEIIGATAPRGPSMIVEPAALAASAPQV